MDDVLSRKPGDFLGDVPAAVSTGYDIAQKRASLKIQEEKLKYEQQENKRALAEKAIGVIPIIKNAKTSAERSFYLKHFSALANQAGMEVSDDLVDLLSKSPETVQNLSSFLESARKIGGDDQAMVIASFADALNAAGRDIPMASNVFAALTEENKSTVAAKLAAQKSELALKANIEKALNSSGASISFRNKLSQLPVAKQSAAAAGHASARKRLDDIARKVLQDEAVLKKIPPEEQDAIKQLYESSLVSIQDPEKAANISGFLDTLEMSINKAIGSGAKTTAEKESEEQKQKDIKQRLEFKDRAVKGLREKFKDEIDTLAQASKALNILNNPELASTPIGADAVVSLMARFVDPKTGVKEGEFARVAAAASGSSIEAAMQMVKAIVKGKVLNPEQREILYKTFQNEVNVFNEKIKTARQILDDELAGTDIDPDAVLLKAFDINPETMQLRLAKDSLEYAFKRDSEKDSFLDWWNGRKQNVVTRTPSPAEKPQAPPKLSDSARSAIQRLRGQSKQQEPQISAAPETAPSKQEKSTRPDFKSMSDKQLEDYFLTGKLPE